MPSRVSLRRLAAYVLLVWLFGLASGIVNACVLGSASPHAAHALIRAGHVHEDGMAMPDSAGHGGHEHQRDQGKPPCERLCDAPVAARAADHDLAAALAGFWLAPAPLPSIAVRAVESADAVPGPDAAPRWRQGVPLPIAFLRLTL
jgi:hypothetical protein